MEPTRARSALVRYRVMAWVVGIKLLLFCLEMVLRYGFGRDWLGFVPFLHGAIYVLIYGLYLVTVLQLWSVMCWRRPRAVVMALAGVVPVMSFLLERRITADVGRRLGAATGAA